MTHESTTTPDTSPLFCNRTIYHLHDIVAYLRYNELMTNYYLAGDAAKVNCRITSRVTNTDNNHSLVSVAVCVSDQHIHRNSQSKGCH